MAKFLLFTDPHISRRPPSSCTESYEDDLFDLLDQITDLACKVQPQAVICAGDVFHLKAASRTPHAVVLRLIGWMKRLPFPLYIVPGNHDMTNDRQDSISATQPLGVLFEAGAILLDGWEQPRLPVGGHPIYGVPWQQSWDAEGLGVVLEAYREFGVGAGPWLHTLVVAHAPLYPPGKELTFEYVPSELWADAMGNAGEVFYGHVHEPHGVWEQCGVTFCNNGALSRGSLHEYNLSRDVVATVWDSDDGSFTPYPLAARPASEVFRLQENKQAVDMSGRLDEFLVQIGETTLAVVSGESVGAHIAGLDIPEGDKTLARELLEFALSGEGKS